MADADVPVKYMDRTRQYYRACGPQSDRPRPSANTVISRQSRGSGTMSPGRGSMGGARRLVS
jgi:hypothetical protein